MAKSVMPKKATHSSVVIGRANLVTLGQEVGARLKHARLLKKISLAYVAQRAGIRAEILYLLEEGKSQHAPSFQLMERLAEVLGVSSWWLWALVHDMEP